VGLHPMTVIMSVIAWTLILGGLLGAILAVPLTASIKVLFQRYVWHRLPSEGVLAGIPLVVGAAAPVAAKEAVPAVSVAPLEGEG
jgi:predicted PurR-regulated permease PerM